jgi:hypothetical protein
MVNQIAQLVRQKKSLSDLSLAGPTLAGDKISGTSTAKMSNDHIKFKSSSNSKYYKEYFITPVCRITLI